MSLNSIFARNWQILSVIFIMLAGALFCTRQFLNPSLSSYFQFSVCGALFFLISGIYLLHHHQKKIKFLLQNPILCSVLGGMVYMFVQWKVIGGPAIPQWLYICSIILIWVSSGICFNVIQRFGEMTAIVILLVVILESLTCILQQFKLTQSMNEYFLVTGSWPNPNVTAIFLAVCSPILFLRMLTTKKGILKSLFIMGLLFTVSAIICLKCRTAYLGLVFGVAGAALNLYSRELGALFRNNRLFRIGLVMSFFLLLIMGVLSYGMKKRSADARITIWLTSLNIISLKPIFGFGFGSFERNYNLYKNPDAGKEVILNNQKMYSKSAYNELLEIAIEGGVVSVLITLSVYITAIYRSLNVRKDSDRENCIIKAITVGMLLGFGSMSLVNFTIQAIPVMVVLALHMGILLKNESREGDSHPELITSSNTKIFAFVFILAGTLMLYFELNYMYGNLEIKKANNYLRQEKIRPALNILSKNKTLLMEFESFWMVYSKALRQAGENSAFISALEKLKSFNSDPNIFLELGKQYTYQRNFKAAETNLITCVNLSPIWLKPRVYLMEFYMSQKHYEKARNQAYEIIKLKATGDPSKIKQYKLKAQKVLMFDKSNHF